MSNAGNVALKQLRQKAGYASARSFAEASGIPVSTYSRYEQSADNLMVSTAKEIADKLACTVEQLVGATDSESSAIQIISSSLSDESRKQLLDYAHYLQDRDSTKKRQKKAAEKRELEGFVRNYLSIMRDEGILDGSNNLVAFGGNQRKRQAFIDFINSRAESNAQSEARKAANVVEQRASANGYAEYYAEDENGEHEEHAFVGEADYGRILQIALEIAFMQKLEEVRKNNRKLIGQLISTYDDMFSDDDDTASSLIEAPF